MSFRHPLHASARASYPPSLLSIVLYEFALFPLSFAGFWCRGGRYFLFPLFLVAGAWFVLKNAKFQGISSFRKFREKQKANFG